MVRTGTPESAGFVFKSGMAHTLLHPYACGMAVILCLDQRDQDLRLDRKTVVGALSLTLTDQSAAHDDPASGEPGLLADSRRITPARGDQCTRDELRSDFAFAHAALVHRMLRNSCSG